MALLILVVWSETEWKGSFNKKGYTWWFFDTYKEFLFLLLKFTLFVFVI